MKWQAGQGCLYSFGTYIQRCRKEPRRLGTRHFRTLLGSDGFFSRPESSDTAACMSMGRGKSEEEEEEEGGWIGEEEGK